MRVNDFKAVVLKLEGGLGNQLFQLAAGYYVASKLNTELILDQYSIPLTTVHGEKRNGFEQFEIPPLPSKKSIVYLDALPKKLAVFLARRSLIIKKILIKLRMSASNPEKLALFLETNSANSTKDLLKIDIPMKLHGNFQSWTIVEKASEFGFPKVLRLCEIPVWIKTLENDLDIRDGIALHFRVGLDARRNYNFRQPKMKYYLKALELLKNRRNPKGIYVLSDNIEQTKDLFRDKIDVQIRYLEMPDDSSPAERMYVLSLFGGIICANSSFCGWAAWSIYNSGGDVIVPVPYSDGQVLGSRDFPSTWIQLDKYTGDIVQ